MYDGAAAAAAAAAATAAAAFTYLLLATIACDCRLSLAVTCLPSLAAIAAATAL
jgi:hypothetical protein